MNVAGSFSFLCIFTSTTLLHCGDAQSNAANGLKLYKSLFKHKRNEQLEAVKSILRLQEYQRKYQMIQLMIRKIADVTSKGKAILEQSGYVPGNDFPEDKDVREALAQTVENAALFGDILLRMPDITHEILNKDREWSLIMKWSIGWSNSTGIYDKKTTELMNLVAQELNIVERSPNYRNPYRKETQALPHMEEKLKSPGKKPKRKIPKGPRLSGARHTEL